MDRIYGDIGKIEDSIDIENKDKKIRRIKNR